MYYRLDVEDLLVNVGAIKSNDHRLACSSASEEISDGVDRPVRRSGRAIDIDDDEEWD